MEITLEKSDALNALIKVRLSEADYQEKVEKKIKDYAKKASINGFRPGKVPSGLIRKMYGKSIKVESINDLASNSLMEYIKTNGLSLLGGPLLSFDDEAAKIDWESQAEFEFKYDIGLRPELSPVIGPQIALTAYQIQVDDEAVNKYIDNLTQMQVQHEQMESVVDQSVTIYGRLMTESGEAVEIPGDMSSLGEESQPTPTLPRLGKGNEDYGVVELAKLDEVHHEMFLGKEKGELVTFDLRTLFPTDAEVGELVGLEAERVTGLHGSFVLTLEDIRSKLPLVMDQAFFDSTLGAGKATSEEEFREVIRAILARRYGILTKDMLVVAFQEETKKANPVELPREFLKRWLAANKDIGAEQAEKAFAQMEEQFEWEILRNSLAKSYNVTINDEDVMVYLRDASFLQILNMNFLSMLNFEERFANSMMNNSEDQSKVDSYYSIALTYKLFNALRDQLTIEEQIITETDFIALKS